MQSLCYVHSLNGENGDLQFTEDGVVSNRRSPGKAGTHAPAATLEVPCVP